jgi:uncharacterized protein YjbI with pentapeptide repeats
MHLTWLALILAAPGNPGTSFEEPSPSVRTWSAKEVVSEVARTGQLSSAEVDDDLDLSRLDPPADKGRIKFSQVTLRGRLLGTPRYPLVIEQSSVCTLGPSSEGAIWQDVQLHWVSIARVQLDRAHLGGQFSCVNCILCRADFVGSTFDQDASFVETTRVGANEAAGACVRRRPVTCAPADFTDAIFRSTARFDGVEFVAGARFEDTEFQASARFPRAFSGQPIRFVGARMRGDADFRDCRLAGLEFGLETPGSYESSSFAARADFRDCTFSGPVRFDNAEFRGDTTFARARLQSEILSFRGVLASKPLDLRELAVEPRTKLLLDAMGADTLRVSWGALGPAVLRGARDMAEAPRVAMLDALSSRLAADGSPRAARVVAFESERCHRPEKCGERWGSCLLGEAQWWLWTLPTQNGSDPTVVLVALFLLWAAVVLAAAWPGNLVLPRPVGRASNDPVYLPHARNHAATSIQTGRVTEAVLFATRLVFKLGKTRARWMVPERESRAKVAAAALRTVWWAGWALMGVAAGVLATSFPGLASFVKLGG